MKSYTSLLCKWCGKIFWPRKGHQRYCSSSCRDAYWNDRMDSRHILGPCPTCGKTFKSRNREKIYCSQDCYIHSEQFIKQRAENTRKQQKPPRLCQRCGKKTKGHQYKYCSNQCRRRYFAERFDRWVANPESVALPQNFDEFLSRNILPCPVSGCGWQGVHLGSHVNFTHGVTAREFKKLCGFNLRTGLIGEESARIRSELSKKFYEEGVIVLEPNYSSKGPEPGYYVSLERKEHAKKTRADMPALRDEFLPCRMCGKSVQQPSCGQKLYCSTKCRSSYYQNRSTEELRCAYCGQMFVGKRAQALRSKKSLPVCCSYTCRNRMNIVAAIASRRR